MSTARGFLGAGSIFLEVFDPVSQVFLAPAGPFESEKFEIKATTKLVEQTSRSREQYGAIIEAVPIPQPTEISVSLAEVNKQSLALALLGTTASLTQAGATVADEVVVAPALGSWVRLANYALTSAPVVVTNSAASTTYVEGTDYEVNRNVGFFRALIGGAIVAAQSLKVDYVAAAVAGTKIRGATNAQVRAKITFDGVNLADGSMCLVDVYEAVFSSSNAFDFLSDKFNSVPLAGRLKTPTGKTEPFVVRLPQG